MFSFSFLKAPRIVERTPFKGIFEIEALYPGYGVTIGNSLRRVLLSSLEGAAVTEVKIKGVPHEFSTMEGVLEDAVTIHLNLKKLRFRMHGEEPQIATLQLKGEREAKGSDLKLPPQLELINKDLVIAHLTSKNTTLEMELRVEKGLGYVPVERRKREKEHIGTISLDAIFSPIRQVGYRVEQMRVGERTDFDRLTLTIETDGTIDPEAAFKKACTILLEQYNMIAQGLKEETIQPRPSVPEEEKTGKKIRKKKSKK